MSSGLAHVSGSECAQGAKPETVNVCQRSTCNIGSTETLSSTARVPAAAPDNMYILFNLGLHTRLIDIVNCVIGLCHIHSYVIQSMSETPRADCADTDARDGSFNGPGEES